MNQLRARLTPTVISPLAAAVLAALSATSPEAHAQDTSPERVDEVIVTSSIVPQPRRQIGTAVSAIDFEEIELRGYADLAGVLRTQTGIGISNSGGPGKSTSVRIRGEEGYRTTLIIDGVKSLDPSGTQALPTFDSLLTTSDLQRVEILRGPQGFMYGADAGGVINVLTKRGADDLGGQVGLEFGEYATRKLDAAFSGGSDNGDYYVSVANLETDGFNARTDDTDLRDDDGADNTTVHTKLGWNVSDDLRLQLVVRNIDAETGFDNCFPGNDCVATTEQTTYRVSADYATGNLSNSFGYSNVDITRDNLNAGVSTFATEGELGRLEYTGSFKPSDAFALVYGLDLQEEKLVASDGTQSRDQNGYYVEYQGAFDDAFFLSLGARYDDNDDFGTHTSSRLSAAYVQDLGTDGSLKYRASVGTGFRAPSLYEFAYNTGPWASPPAFGLALREESSEGYDLGIEYDAGNGLHFEVTYFDQDIDNAIDFDNVAWSGYLQPPGTSTSKGIEIGADIPFGDRWQLVANWTNNDAKGPTGEQRALRPKNLGNFGLLYRNADNRFDFVANVRMSKDAVETDGLPLDDYEVIDLAASYHLSPTFELFGRIENATDETYQEVRGYNTAERAANVGMRVRF